MNIDVARNLAIVKQRVAKAAVVAGKAPEDITLVAVSKRASADSVKALVAAGHRDFGENRVQEGLKKIAAVTGDDLRWHLIGRIQTNKVKYLSPFGLIHSLDRWDLADKMSNYAVAKGIQFQCLLQVNVAADPAKAGIPLKEADDFLIAAASLGGLSLRGLMTITALDAGEAQTRAWFESLAGKFNALSRRQLPENVGMDWLSMGMSGDFELAIAAGANMVRVGSAIFAGEDDQYA